MRNKKRINELARIKVLFEIGFDAWDIAELETLSVSLHHLAEAYCNGDLTPRQEKREKRLMERVNELCKDKAEFVQHLGDPRGGSGFVLYFGDKLGGRYAYHEGSGNGFYI